MMILFIGYVVFLINFFVGIVIKEIFIFSFVNLIVIIILIGGIVGGYIMFFGGYRFIDVGIIGEENLL